MVYVCGDEIIREGAPSDALYFIAAGKVNVLKQAAAGQPGSGDGHEAPLTSLGAGTLFGEISLLSLSLTLTPTLNPNPTPQPQPHPDPKPQPQR